MHLLNKLPVAGHTDTDVFKRSIFWDEAMFVLDCIYFLE